MTYCILYYIIVQVYIYIFYYAYRAFSQWIAPGRRSLRADTLSAPLRKFSPRLFPCRSEPETKPPGDDVLTMFRR